MRKERARKEEVAVFKSQLGRVHVLIKSGSIVLAVLVVLSLYTLRNIMKVQGAAIQSEITGLNNTVFYAVFGVIVISFIILFVLNLITYNLTTKLMQSLANTNKSLGTKIDDLKSEKDAEIKEIAMTRNRIMLELENRKSTPQTNV